MELLDTESCTAVFCPCRANTAERSLQTSVCIRQIMADYRSTGKELRKSPKGMIAGLIALTLLGISGYGVYRTAMGMRALDALPVPGSDTEISVPEISDIGTE